MIARFSGWLSSISPKLYAAAAGAGGGAAVNEFVVWLLGVTVWNAPYDAGSYEQAVAAVPEPVAGMVAVVLVAAGVLLGAYMAPGTVAAPVEHEAAPVEDFDDAVAVEGPIHGAHQPLEDD